MTERIDSVRGERFSPEVLRRFFDAVEVNDAVGPVDPLPPRIDMPCTDAQVRACFALCAQFWDEGVRRSDLARLVDDLVLGRDPSAAQRLAFKHIRARFKQLRFAQRLYDQRHKADLTLEIPTVLMGELQDAFRNRERRRVLAAGLLLRVMVLRPVWWFMRWRALNARLDDAAGVDAHRRRLMEQLREHIAAADFTGRQFHALRWVVSQQVSYYDMRRSLQPARDLDAIARYLACLNGLMGARHDQMVADALAGRSAYDTRTRLDPEIRAHLEALVARYPRPSLVPSNRTQPLAR